jgi:NAD(P)-dependent dehydrogenase (short-subunit alcohol dehydrogenase family)
MEAPRTAVVTGASRGIGRAIAERLAAEGWDLLLSARGGPGLDDAVAHMAGSAADVRAVAADMSAPADVEALARACNERGDELDLLVLAAGIGSGGPIEGYPMHRLDRQFAVNVRAPFQLVSLLLPALRAAAARRPALGARVVAISSITGQAAEPGLAAYGATKSALTLLCETITAEEGVNGVLATAIAPGYVDTDMTTWVHGSIPPDQMMKTSDIAEIALAITRLSPCAAVPAVIMTRPGPNLHRALRASPRRLAPWAPLCRWHQPNDR